MVGQAADYIEKKVEEAEGKPFEKVRILFLELSALFGAVAKQYWVLDEFLFLSCDLKFPESKNVETGWGYCAYSMVVEKTSKEVKKRKNIKYFKIKKKEIK